MVYGDFKDLARRAASDKVLRDKAFNIAKNYYDGTQNYLVLRLIHRCFKRVAGFGSSNYIYGNVKDCLMKILQLLQQLTIALIHN